MVSNLNNKAHIRMSRHWSSDPYFVDALDKYTALRNAGQKTLELDLDAIEEVISNRDGPAYRLFDAMVNIKETEGDEGYRGAPRILLAILEHLGEISKQKQTD
ncbi:hypothetical protein AA18889_2124 [Acetobacter senegalensis DSM 18889]|nr:hypothetical protein AA18889_2124 [Acetobacter senegalensis DSM 18889]